LGAAMDSSAFFSSGEKYCHNGGMAFAHHHGVGLPGVHDGDHGPFRRSLENARLQLRTSTGFSGVWRGLADRCLQGFPGTVWRRDAARTPRYGLEYGPR
jgi:hypothetical protein